MADKIKLEIITPEGITFSDEVDMVTLPGVEGEMGIYPQHVPLMTQVVPGEVSARTGTEEVLLAIGEGFVEITAERVAIMTDMAFKADDLDAAQMEEARKRAEARMRERLSAEEIATANAALLRSVEHIQTKKRHRR
jgi:F-type H+-transporting ATPase subunit epsilon